MKVVTNSVLTVELDDSADRDFLAALDKIAKRDNATPEKALDGVVANFFSTGGEPSFLCPAVDNHPKGDANSTRRH